MQTGGKRGNKSRDRLERLCLKWKHSRQGDASRTIKSAALGKHAFFERGKKTFLSLNNRTPRLPSFWRVLARLTWMIPTMVVSTTATWTLMASIGLRLRSLSTEDELETLAGPINMLSGTSLTTAPPIIRLTTAKVPAGQKCNALIKGIFCNSSSRHLNVLLLGPDCDSLSWASCREEPSCVERPQAVLWTSFNLKKEKHLPKGSTRWGLQTLKG